MESSLAWAPGLWEDLAALRPEDRVELLDGHGRRRRFIVVARLWSQRLGVTSITVRQVKTGERFIANRNGWKVLDARDAA